MHSMCKGAVKSRVCRRVEWLYCCVPRWLCVLRLWRYKSWASEVWPLLTNFFKVFSFAVRQLFWRLFAYHNLEHHRESHTRLFQIRELDYRCCRLLLVLFVCQFRLFRSGSLIKVLSWRIIVLYGVFFNLDCSRLTMAYDFSWCLPVPTMNTY